MAEVSDIFSEKRVFRLIKDGDSEQLKSYLYHTKNSNQLLISINKRTGHTALLLAAHKNNYTICEILISFVLNDIEEDLNGSQRDLYTYQLRK